MSLVRYSEIMVGLILLTEKYANIFSDEKRETDETQCQSGGDIRWASVWISRYGEGGLPGLP